MMMDAAIDVSAGTLAGMMQVIIGHPLDTIKVRMQTNGAVLRVQSPNTGFSSLFSSLHSTLSTEGVAGLYKGSASPLLGAMATNAVCFLSWGIAKKLVMSEKNSKDPGELFLSGLLSGSMALIVENPVDLLKTQLQVQVGTKGGVYSGVFDCAKQIYASRGLSGFYQGVGANALRFVPGRAVYLTSFEYSLNQIDSSEQPSLASCFIAGAIAGGCAWTSTYPFDVVRNRMMGDSCDPSKRRYRGVSHCISSIVRNEGIKGFWKGYVPCLVRAVPVNGVVFTTYTIISRKLFMLASQ